MAYFPRNTLPNKNLPPLTPTQMGLLQQAKKYASQVSVAHVMKKQQELYQKQAEMGFTGPDGIVRDQNYLERQQVLLFMTRVYVGSIDYDLKEEVVKNAFLPFGPLKTLNMSFDPITGKNKSFAFIEYETPEAAQLALDQMAGVVLGPRAIKVGRPANMPHNAVLLQQLLDERKDQKRIYISSIDDKISKSDIQEVFGAFGNVISCDLVIDTATKQHRSYGFLEYDTVAAADDACASMNIFDLGGKFLRVGKAIAPKELSLQNVPSVPIRAYNAVPPPTQIPTPKPVVPKKSKFLPPPPEAVIPAPGLIQPVVNNFNPPPNNIPPPGVVNPIQQFGGPPPPRPQTFAPPPQQQFPPPGQYPVPVPPPGMMPRPPMPPHGYPPNPNFGYIPPQPPLPPQNSQYDISQLPNTLSSQEDLKVHGVGGRHLMMQKLMRKESETCTMVLYNMVNPDQVDDTLEEEITEECGKYGQVKNVVIYTEPPSQQSAAIVKIFVMFATHHHCNSAITNLNGRYFGGRTIQALHFPQEKFNCRDFSNH